MMPEIKPRQSEEIWKVFLRRHWRITSLIVAGIILSVIGAILVFWSFAADARSTGLVPATLDLWTMGHIVTFVLNLIFWEIIRVGIPIIVVAALIYLLWWNKLPAAERDEYKRGHLFTGPGSRRSSGQGAFSFLVFIAFIIKIYVDGNWNVPFSTWTFDYLVTSFVWVLIWILVIFGIPLVLGGSLWLRHEMKKAA